MNIPKQDNMAAVEEVATEEAMLILEEPIRADLKEMLVDIQINISNIFTRKRTVQRRHGKVKYGTQCMLCIHASVMYSRQTFLQTNSLKAHQITTIVSICSVEAESVDFTIGSVALRTTRSVVLADCENDYSTSFFRTMECHF